MRYVVFLVVLLVAFSVASSAGAQSTSKVDVSLPNSVTEGSQVAGELIVSDITDPDGVGSFTINVTYDPDVVSVSASEVAPFEVATSTPEPGVLRIVGFTGDLPGPTGTVTLVTLQVTGAGTGDSALSPIVESLTNAEGDEIANLADGAHISVTGSSTTPSDDTSDKSSTPVDDTGSPPASTDAPTVSVTGSATATINVTDGGAIRVSITKAVSGDRIAVRETKEQIEQRLQENGAAFEGLDVGFSADAAGDLEIGFSTDSPDSSLPNVPSDRGAIGYITVDHSMSDETISDVTFQFRVADERLSDLGIDRNEVVLYRFHDGAWTALETEHVGTASDGSLRFEADSPGLSTFAIGSSQADDTQTPESTDETPEATDETPEPTDGTPEPTDETSEPTDGTPEPADGTSTPEPESAGASLGFSIGLAVLALGVIGAAVYFVVFRD